MSSPLMASPVKQKKQTLLPSLTYVNTTLLFFITLSIPALLLLHSSPAVISSCSSSATQRSSLPWRGDLRAVEFAWNRLEFDRRPPAAALKIAVFSRKWPLGAAPGGMERHALTLYTALARRGHRVHVFTSAPPPGEKPVSGGGPSPEIHFLDKAKWDYHEAWARFAAENRTAPYDVVHSESVALPHGVARSVPNLAVSWHGIALEALYSKIHQDLTRKPDEPMSPAVNESMTGVVQKILTEIRFFHAYAHHIAISDNAGEMLRDVYQIPSTRVHVILNGVDGGDFAADELLGREFRARYGVPANASLVLGVSGRLVKDKGHPLLHEAFWKLISDHPEVYLIVAGAGPWEQRYRELGQQVVALGALPPQELRAFYNALDVFVNPTLRPQGLDLTLMEAMMCGKPIVATRFPSIRGSILVEEEFGFSFAPNVAALLEALRGVVAEGPRRMAARGRACRKYAAAMFTAEKMALAYERLFLCIKDDRFCEYPAAHW